MAANDDEDDDPLALSHKWLFKWCIDEKAAPWRWGFGGLEAARLQADATHSPFSVAKCSRWHGKVP